MPQITKVTTIGSEQTNFYKKFFKNVFLKK